MPQIIIKGIGPDVLRPLAPAMIEQLAQAIGCPEDWMTIELTPSLFFDKSGQVPGYPIVQVWWFQRPREVQEQVTKILHTLLMPTGCPMVQISYHLFSEEDYYEFERPAKADGAV